MFHCCPELRYFVTLTLSKDKIDRYDVGAITKKLNIWLDNKVRRDGLSYILVAERHKDGAVHFHGFINGALTLTDSGTMTKDGWKKPRKWRSERQRALWASEGAHTVYNVPAWKYGFTTAIELYGERERALGYVCKYLTKQTEGGKVGGRWYYHGGIQEEYEERYLDITTQDIVAEHDETYYIWAIPEAGLVMGKKGFYGSR